MENKVLKYFRWLIYIAELYFLYLLQPFIGISLNGYDARPLLIIPAFISISLFEREYTAMMFGALAGFLLDAGMGNVLGGQAILLCLIGYALGVISTYFIKSNLLSAMASAVIIIPIVVALRFYFTYVLAGYGHILYAFERYCSGSIIFSILLTPVIFFINRIISYFVCGNEGEQDKV